MRYIIVPRHQSKIFLTAFSLSLAASLSALPQQQPSQSTNAPKLTAEQSHAKMLSVLREIQTSSPDENYFFGTSGLITKRAALQSAGSAADWQLRLDTAIAELQQGNERAGLAILEAARAGLLDGSIPGDAAARGAIHFNLGVAYLRLAETQNCCKIPTIDSCVLPIRGGGLHQDKEGSTNAIPCFMDVLANSARESYWHLAALWLLNLAHMTLGTWPEGVPVEHRIPAAAFAPESNFPAFTNIAPQLGLDTMGLAGGIIVDDFDNDGYLDVLTSDWHTSGPLRLWHNRHDGTFLERTKDAGLTGLFGGLNIVQADYDNDGDLDFLVLRGAWWFEKGRHPKSLVRNNGDGTFTDVTFMAGLGDANFPSQTAAFADYDNDGDLDIYIGNESSSRLRCASQLYENHGDGTFTEVAALAGVENFGFTKGVTWGDYDGDRLPDLYVSNLANPNRLYHNVGSGHFIDVAPQLNVTAPEAGFPAWFWDYDNDGVLDIYASSYATGIGHIAAWYLGVSLPYEPARLYHGDGHGGFIDVAKTAGLDYPAMPMGSSFGDLDNDGLLDCYLGTGDPHYYSLMPNVMFLNRGGSKFAQVTMAGRFGLLQKGHAIAFADWDNDGDADVFAQMGGAYPGDAFRDVVFANPGFGNHWITVQLVGTKSNRSAIGARIRAEIVELGQRRVIYRHVNSGGSFSGNPMRQTIGLGKAEQLKRLEVFWPRTGETQAFANVTFDRGIRIVEGDAMLDSISLPPLPTPPLPLKK